MTALAEGTVIAGRYRLERLIASGAMALVWCADDEVLGRPVAVKVISDVLASQDDWRARFEREARVAAKLTHPNLVVIYDFGSEGESRPYLVMELVESGSLTDVLARAGVGGDRGGVEVDLEALAEDVLSALAHIHEAGIVHRDVKPQNVLIADDGRALLTDFGIAHPEDATRLTRLGEVLGTREYIAPEVLAGNPADPRSDLYACGVMLLEVARSQAVSDSERVGRLATRLSRAEPEARPATAAEALAELREGAEGPITEETRAVTVAETAVLPPPGRRAARLRGAGSARHVRPDVRRALGAIRVLAGLAAIAAATALLVVLVSSDGDGATAGVERDPAPREAPLSEHLDAVEAMIGELGGQGAP